MENLNYVLFEEFKHLDKLCGELYEGQQGVSHYIEDMKEVSEKDYRHIPNWKADLGQLVRIRHIRNYLAHTEGAFDEEACTQADIDWIRNFYGRILNQSDPLAMLHQFMMAKQQRADARKSASQPQAYQPSAPNDEIGGAEKDVDLRKQKDMGSSAFLLFTFLTVWLVLLAVFIVVTVLVDYI